MWKIDIRTGKTHLTGMNARTRLSAKGQVVIPKDVRDRYRLKDGDTLEVVERPDGVLLRRKKPDMGDSFETITARIRARIRYDGPPVSIEEMNESIAEMAARSGEQGNW